MREGARRCNRCKTCFPQMFKGGHTATQNRTRKNTRRSHILRVQNTQGLKGPAEDRLQPLVVFHLLSVVRPW